MAGPRQLDPDSLIAEINQGQNLACTDPSDLASEITLHACIQSNYAGSATSTYGDTFHQSTADVGID